MGVLAAAMVMASGDEIALESSGVGGGGGGWWRLHRVTEIRSEERLPVIGRSGEEKESRFAMPCHVGVGRASLSISTLRAKHTKQLSPGDLL
jgi:hypothetical protein